MDKKFQQKLCRENEKKQNPVNFFIFPEEKLILLAKNSWYLCMLKFSTGRNIFLRNDFS